ncbi:MAG: biotin--[acetyl-CoA-carboxylase] ligase [Flammeovirgaceae bacterium]|nr:biotin--[acetyl-CoA-carboxylase] ligase [Flammeovirgaceae bacterium]
MYKIPAKTLFTGQNLIFRPECRSTNTYLMELGDVSEGTVVITADQTSGRGQRGNAWSSEKGKNITASILFKPGFLLAKNQFWLTMVASLAVRDTLFEFDLSAKIKWPNDIMVDEKKICGILIENQLTGSSISKSVVGIGLNVNQEKFNLEKVTSVYQQIGREASLQEILDLVLEKLEARYLQLRQNKNDQLKEEYLKSLYWLNELHTFSNQQGMLIGIIQGVDELGRLVIDCEKERKIFDLKEIVFVK